MPAKNVVKSTQRTRSPNWTDAMDVILLTVLKEQQLLGNCVDGQIKREAWEDIIPAFNQQAGGNMGKDQLKNRIKVLKNTFLFYYSLASRSGWSWDYVLNKPTPKSLSEWETAIEENPKYAKCKERPFLCYKALEMFLGKSIIIGKDGTTTVLDDDCSGDDTSLACPEDIDTPRSSGVKLIKGASPSSSRHLCIRTPDLLAADFPSSVPIQPSPISARPNPLNPQTPVNEPPLEDQETPARKRYRSSPSAPCACKIRSISEAKILSELAEVSRKCLEIARELVNRDSVEGKKANSIEECIEKLTGMHGLSDETMLTAIEAFKDDDNRSIFISLNGSLLSAWIDRQVAIQSESHAVVDK